MCNKLFFLVVGGESNNNLHGHKTQPLCPPGGREGHGLKNLGSNMWTMIWNREFN